MTKLSRFNFDEYLLSIYNEKKTKNPSYSIRAFARKLQVDQSALSKVLRKEKRFSTDIVLRCLENLGAPKELIKDIKNEENQLLGDYLEITEGTFCKLPQWKFWAYLELQKTTHRVTDEVAAKKLNTSVDEVLIMKELLISNRLLDASGDLATNNKFINIDSKIDITSKLQEEIGNISLLALKNIRKEFRYHGTILFAVNKESILQLKEKLADLQIEFCAKAVTKGEINEVYAFTSSLVPLTRFLDEEYECSNR